MNASIPSTIARAVAAGALAALGWVSTTAFAAPGAAQVHAEAIDMVIGYRLCAHAYPDFVGRAAPAWAGFRRRYPEAWSEGMRRPGIEEMADRHPVVSDEEALELLSQCTDLLAAGGFDPTREADRRLATPDAALALLEQALQHDDRALLLHVLMGEARFSVRNAFDIDRGGHHALLARVHAGRNALAAAPPAPPEAGVVRGPATAPTLLLEKIRGEWRVGHL